MRTWRFASAFEASAAFTAVKTTCATAFRIPVARAAARVVMRRIAAGNSSLTITGHVVAAGVAASAIALAECCAGPGVAQLVRIAGAAAIAGIAVSAVVHVARSHPTRAVLARPLLSATLVELAPRHGGHLAAKALALACNPGSLLTMPRLGRTAVAQVTKAAVGALVVHPLRAVPLLGPALEIAGAWEAAFSAATLVHDFERTSLSLCQSF